MHSMWKIASLSWAKLQGRSSVQCMALFERLWFEFWVGHVITTAHPRASENQGGVSWVLAIDSG